MDGRRLWRSALGHAPRLLAIVAIGLLVEMAYPSLFGRSPSPPGFVPVLGVAGYVGTYLGYRHDQRRPGGPRHRRPTRRVTTLQALTLLPLSLAAAFGITAVDGPAEGRWWRLSLAVVLLAVGVAAGVALWRDRAARRRAKPSAGRDAPGGTRARPPGVTD
ncbi:hypothetical protein E1091_03375 [Micromonospora fluostatini]|uniref:Uncharacterized protein n=1 Tax=Micromonospora fluostatini TaxID=1629071 RepID=A0ABY2DKG3_9ACTN|nr:hypothetical protein E1091_03375 [Micromonospora fluostatini]